jgi:hypothetical protein
VATPSANDAVAESQEDGEPAVISSAVSEEAPEGGSADSEGFVWPEGTAPHTESESGATSEAATAETPLPKLDELTKRIPPAILETLDELFRARFVAVRRVSAKTLKTG